jgi:hypothetical protein
MRRILLALAAVLLAPVGACGEESTALSDSASASPTTIGDMLAKIVTDDCSNWTPGWDEPPLLALPNGEYTSASDVFTCDPTPDTPTGEGRDDKSYIAFYEDAGTLAAELSTRLQQPGGAIVVGQAGWVLFTFDQAMVGSAVNAGGVIKRGSPG